MNDGKEFVTSVDVAQGSAAPNLLGKFHDKTAIEVDRTGGQCDGNVYFRVGAVHGRRVKWLQLKHLLRPLDRPRTDVLEPDEAEPDGARHPVPGHRRDRQRARVRDLPRVRADVRSNTATDAIAYNASTDCGASFSQPQQVLTFEPCDPTDISVGGGVAGECGDFASACVSGYTFMRGGTQIRSTADQSDNVHDYL